MKGGDAGEGMAGMKISPEKILQELAAIAFARVPECMEIVGSDVKLKDIIGLSIGAKFYTN
jgi:hypothetical protein